MPTFEKTAKQEEANILLGGPAKHILLRGGARSGKTFLFVRALVARSLKTKSRHLAIRKHFAHVKQSIWYDTFPTVISLCFPEMKGLLHEDKSDWFITFPNGSELWFGGLDDKERTDKILGKEYSTIFFNECSEMSYESVGIAQTRLAQKNGLIKKCYYDCNPPKESHWSNKLFLQKIDPLSEIDAPISNPEHYVTMKLNPKDNEANLDPAYIPEILEKLPPALRLRFLDGEYGSDDNDIIQPHWIVPTVGILRPEDIAAKFSFCDPAYTEEARKTEGSCESAIITVGIDYDSLIHDVEVLHGYWSYEELKKNCVAVNERHRKCENYIFGVEDVAAQRWLHEDLQRVGVHTVLIKPDGDKIRRTISVTDLMEQGRTRINDPILMKQLLGFPGEKLKDLVDSYVGCLKLVKRYGGEYKRKNEEKPLTYDERVHRYMRQRNARLARIRKGEGIDPTLGRTW